MDGPPASCGIAAACGSLNTPMMKTISLLLVLCVTVLAGERQAAVFRLKKSPGTKVKVWALEVNDDGMRIEFLGTHKKAFVRWADIVDGDAHKLRLKYGLDLSDDERKGLVPGGEVFFRGGMSVIGIVEGKDIDKNEIYIRSDGMVLAYPLDRLDRIEKIKVKEIDVYDEDEIYAMRLERRPPTNWGDHRRLADHMVEIGNYRKAQEHYLEAIKLNPDLRPKVEPRLAEIKDVLDDEEAYVTIRKAKSIANLWGRYSDATAMLEQYAEERPGSRRRIALVLDEIEVTRVRKVTARYHRVKYREADRAIKDYLLRKAPTLDEARSWISGPFKKELAERLQRRMRMSEEELEAISKTKAKGALHWTTYGNGSFVLDPKAKKGRSSGKQIRGDPEGWWRAYGDVSTRSAWLRAYAAEKLPGIFEVVTVRVTPCAKCGGTGQVKHSSVRGLEALGGAHEWRQTCPRCFGAGRDRGIGFK